MQRLCGAGAAGAAGAALVTDAGLLRLLLLAPPPELGLCTCPPAGLCRLARGRWTLRNRARGYHLAEGELAGQIEIRLHGGHDLVLEAVEDVIELGTELRIVLPALFHELTIERRTVRRHGRPEILVHNGVFHLVVESKSLLEFVERQAVVQQGQLPHHHAKTVHVHLVCVLIRLDKHLGSQPRRIVDGAATCLQHVHLTQTKVGDLGTHLRITIH
mmetsp:Transcript_42652/g.107662  ORF Transcript_42652/g.107662 Transcript_42652/m.107662 type:complete len:216 (-) Transcript_42652:572-1219(-)